MFESVYAQAEVDVNLLTALLSHSLRQHLSVQPRVHRLLASTPSLLWGSPSQFLKLKLQAVLTVTWSLDAF